MNFEQNIDSSENVIKNILTTSNSQSSIILTTVNNSSILHEAILINVSSIGDVTMLDFDSTDLISKYNKGDIETALLTLYADDYEFYNTTRSRELIRITKQGTIKLVYKFQVNGISYTTSYVISKDVVIRLDLYSDVKSVEHEYESVEEVLQYLNTSSTNLINYVKEFSYSYDIKEKKYVSLRNIVTNIQNNMIAIEKSIQSLEKKVDDLKKKIEVL